MSLSAAAFKPQVRDALAAYLIAVADDELIIGHRHSEWTGFAPDIESDVALSSIAQEEIGHARLFYERACDLIGGDPDHVAFWTRLRGVPQCRTYRAPQRRLGIFDGAVVSL